MNLSLRSSRHRIVDRRTAIATLIGPFIAGVVSSAPARASEYRPVPLNPRQKVTVGVLGSMSDSGILIAADRGYFSDEGLDVEQVRFKSLTDMIPLLGREQLDVGGGGVAVGLFNSAARGVSLSIVADKGHVPGPRPRSGEGSDYQVLMVRKDLITSGNVRNYANLRGLKIALVGGRGSTGEVVVAQALSRGKLTLNDVDLVSMTYPDLVPAFANKSIDVAIVIEPFVTRIESQGTAVIWKTTTDLLGPSQLAVIVYSESFSKRQEAARHFMIAYIRGVRDYDDAFALKHTNYDDTIKIIAKETHATPKLYDDVLAAGLDPNGKLAMRSLQEQLDYFARTGELNTKVDLRKLVNSSFATFAVAQLGQFGKE